MLEAGGALDETLLRPPGRERLLVEPQQLQDPESQEKTGGGGLCLHTANGQKK